MSNGKKIYTLELSELDMKVLLECLAMKQAAKFQVGESTKTIDILIERAYWAAGVRLD